MISSMHLVNQNERKVVANWLRNDRCAGSRDGFIALVDSILTLADGKSTSFPAPHASDAPNTTVAAFSRNE